MAVGFPHVMQCAFWSFRAAQQQVDPIFHAIEMILVLVVAVDILAAWLFVVSRGATAVLTAAINGRVLLDSFVAVSVVALIVKDETGRRTWFNFSFLASVRLFWIINFLQRTDAYDSNSNWRRQILFHGLSMVIFVYASACTLLTLERLGVPALTKDTPPWDLPSSVVFAITTVFTVGDAAMAPKTVLGRAFTMGLICWSVKHLFTRVLPLMISDVLGQNLGRGSYRPGMFQNHGHIVVFGTPTAPMLWDFLLEIFHPNHFDGMSSFDRLAPDVVVLVPHEQTLAHLWRFLGRPESVLFRDRVRPLLGDAFSLDDLHRVSLGQARRAIVLPNLSTADAVTDDHENVMRMFALTGIAPYVPSVCMLHRAEDPRAFLPPDNANSVFLSIDSFKLSMMAIACLTPGALTFVSNLCGSRGSLQRGKPWQHEYERSMGCELYEVPLSSAYHGVTFGEAFEDVLLRSDIGDVFLVGIIETTIYDRLVCMHPGNDVRLLCMKGATQGVFIAPDITAIRQCQSGEVLLSHSPDSLPPTPTTGSPRNNSRFEITNPTLPSSPSEESSESTPLNSSRTANGKDRSERNMHWEQTLAEKGYQRSMAQVQRGLLVTGLSINVVSEVATKLQEGARLKDWDPGVGAKVRTKPKRQPSEVDIATNAEERATSVPADFDDRRFSMDGRFSVDGSMSPRLFTRNAPQARELELQVRNLGRLNAVRDRMEREALSPQAPPAILAKCGGHLLLCVVGDTACSCDGRGPAAGLGQEIGIGRFMRPLRDRRMKVSVMHPTVIVIAEALPADWHAVADVERVFFVAGSPLSLRDLDLCGFRKARAIALVHGRSAAGGATLVSDSRMVLAATLIEKHLPRDSHTRVITDHAYFGSCAFLPLGAAIVEDGENLEACNVGEVPDASKLLSTLPRMLGVDTGSLESATTFAVAPRSLDGGLAEEDQESLESKDYLYNTRYMCGDVFVYSALVSLAASTVYSPNLVLLLNQLLQAPMHLLSLPQIWERRSYADFSVWLLRNRNLLAVGIYRSAAAANVGAFGKLDLGAPTHYYFYAGPPAHETNMIRSDRILCIVPHPTP